MTLLVLHTLFCGFMTGAIWLVQVLVYPNFRWVGQAEFSQFHQVHTQRITWVVAPVMVLELSTGAWLVLNQPTALFVGNLISILALWTHTFFINVPMHNRLSYTSPESKDRLVFWNWPRTLLWTLRSVFLLVVVVEHSSKGVT